MARLYVPAVACPSCHYPNDHIFKFCQLCGYQRQNILLPPPSPIVFQLSSIDERLLSLEQNAASSPYSKQKTSLRRELEAFLSALPGRKTLFSAIPQDICRFLVWKDKDAKTQVHVHGCPFLGRRGVSSCECPLRLSYSTVDSYIGKLRAIFNKAGRSGDWECSLQLGNPASAFKVKQFLKCVTEEQLRARVTPKQATPLFLDKLRSLARHIDQKLAAPSTLSQRCQPLEI